MNSSNSSNNKMYRNANVPNTNLFNLFHHHYLLIASHSATTSSLFSKKNDFLVFDLPIIYNENNNTSSRTLHWMEILEKICNGLLLSYKDDSHGEKNVKEEQENGNELRTISSTMMTTIHDDDESQGKNQYHNAVVDKRKFKNSQEDDHHRKISISHITNNGNKNERMTEKNKKRDAFNLHNDNDSDIENRTITFAKLNELPNFPVISHHDDRVINDCPKDIKEYRNCLFVDYNNDDESNHGTKHLISLLTSLQQYFIYFLSNQLIIFHICRDRRWLSSINNEIP